MCTTLSPLRQGGPSGKVPSGEDDDVGRPGHGKVLVGKLGSVPGTGPEVTAGVPNYVSYTDGLD